jgi:hypothetical protein
MKDEVLEKIKKILARADTGRGATQAEAETAMAMVQKLCIEHNISMAQVEAAADADNRPAQKMEAVKGTIKTKTRYEAPYHRPIMLVLQACFDVHIITTPTGTTMPSGSSPTSPSSERRRTSPSPPTVGTGSSTSSPKPTARGARRRAGCATPGGWPVPSTRGCSEA